MAIQPIQFASSELKVPQADYSWLSNLVPNIQQTRANAMKIAAGEREQGALAELGKLNPNDPNYMQQVAQIALRSGNFGAGASILNNAAELKLKQAEAAQEAAIGKRFSGQPGVPPAAAPVAPSATVTPAQPAITTNLPLFGRPESLQQTTPPGGTVAPAIAPVSQTPQTPPILAQAGAPGSNFTGYRAAPDKQTVRFEGVNSDLLQHANAVGNELYGKLNRPLYVTSAKDSVHTRGSQHYDGNALDLRTRDLNVQQRQAIVAGFRAKGLNAVDEGDHIHVSTPRGGAVPPTGGGPGTVTASLQGRGPISGATVAAASRGPIQTAALDPANFNIGNPAVASDISPTPMARTAAVGNQAAGGPANITNPGGEQQALLLPNPTPLQTTPLSPPNAAPSMSLAALGGAPAGTIGPMGGAAGDAMPPQGVQVAQAAQGAPGAYQLPWNFTQPQAPPVLPQQAPVRAPVQQQAAPVQQPVQARGAASGGPLAHVSDADLVAASGSKRWGDVARAEIARRSAITDERVKNPDIIRYNWMKANGYTGTPEDYMRDYGGGQRINVDTAQKADTVRATKQAEADIKTFETYKEGLTKGTAKLATYSVLESAMKMPGFYSGPASAAATWVKQAADTLKIPIEEAGRMASTTAGANELFRAYSNKAVMDDLGGLGAGISTADAARISTVVTSLDETPAGNRMKIAIGRAMAERQRELGRMAIRFRMQDLTGKPKGTFDSSMFEEMAADFADKNPLITDEQLAKAAQGEESPHTTKLKDALKKYPGQ